MTSAPDPLSRILPPALRQLLRGRALTLRRPVWGPRVGRHMSVRAGHGLEFRGHRPYAPGDDLRRLDWRAIARRDRLVYRETHSEDALDLVLAVDDSAGMAYGEGEQQKYRVAAALATALATLAVRQGDRVGLCLATPSRDVARDPVRELLRPAAGQQRLRTLAETLAERPLEGACAWPQVLDRLVAHAPRRSLLVLLGDFLDPDPRARAGAPIEPRDAARVASGEADATDPGERALLDALARPRARGHDVVLVQVVHRDELEFPWGGRELLRLEDSRGQRPAVEGAGLRIRAGYLRRLGAYLERLERACERERVHLDRVVSDAPAGDALLDLLGYLSGSAGRGARDGSAPP
ncbi:MAG: DUF58 domain-containing protein [Myxococcales bacterium]|nr:DUF58 domain-containing protein [Myxococcales bacterium]